jgi:hypothetical protein
MRVVELTICVCIRSERAADFINLMDENAQYELQDLIERSI